MDKKFLIVGDIHGVWSALNTYIHGAPEPGHVRHSGDILPDEIWCVGDFGYWPGSEVFSLKRIKNMRYGSIVVVRWIDGNHENHEAIADLLARAAKKPEKLEQRPGIFYQPRGSHIVLDDGRVVVFIGGAKSVDWEWRKEGRDWFPSEILTEDDLASLPDRADIVISHTLPTRFRQGMFGPPHVAEARARQIENQTGWDLSGDPSEEILDQAFERLRPSLWIFGHFHRFARGETDGCKWTSLADLSDPRGGSWAWLPPA